MSDGAIQKIIVASFFSEHGVEVEVEVDSISTQIASRDKKHLISIYFLLQYKCAVTRNFAIANTFCSVLAQLYKKIPTYFCCYISYIVYVLNFSYFRN